MTSRELTYRWHTYKLLRADRYVLHHCLAIHATVVRKFGMFCAVLSMARILFCPLFSQKINSQISLNYNTLGANVYKPICGIFSRDDWLKMAASEDAHVFISGHLKWSSLEKYFYKNIYGGAFFFYLSQTCSFFLALSLSDFQPLPCGDDKSNQWTGNHNFLLVGGGRGGRSYGINPTFSFISLLL